ncbi:MAG: FosX/FosE/FosI family fosfomycin resistance hydrolase [Clostridiales bacterium]|nr:FosX/FosE/FosI family fosfomycin resistance hydrolase [Clostridiales bacterium]
MITGINHITLIVRDLDAAGGFWRDIFGAEEIYHSEKKLFSIAEEKYFLIGDIWICLMKGDSLPEQTYNHIAFSIPDSEYDFYVSILKAAGLSILPGRSRIEGEGRSLYFYDFDNHLFELHTGTLDERLRSYTE